MQSNKNAAPAEKDLLGKITDALLEGTLGGLIINFLIIPFLCVAIILLPPVSAAQRILDINYTLIDKDGGAVRDPDGMQVTFLPEGIKRAFKVKLTSEPRTSFLEGSAGKELLTAAEAIPANLIMKSPLYRLDTKGEELTAIILTIPIPNDSEPYRTLDLYDWTGKEWRWLPSHLIAEDELIEANLDQVPHNIAVMQTKPLAPSVSADIAVKAKLPAESKDTLVEINPQGLMLNGDGSIGGDLGALPETDQTASYVIVPTLRNWGPDGVVRSDYIDNMLISEKTRRRHIEEIVDLTVRNVYPGIDIYYKGINPDLHQEFTAFIQELALALHTNQKILSVRVEVPTRVAADRWETGVYDWRAIGEAADAMKVPAMTAPNAYKPGGDMESFLQWAVGEVNRYKLQLLISTRSIEQVKDTWAEIPYEQALQPLSQVKIEGDKAVVGPGEQVVFTLANLAQSSGIQFDDPSGTYWFKYTDRGGQERTIYLENAASIARKLQLVAQYNLRGVAVQNLLGENNDAQIWEVIRKFHDLIVPPVQSQFAVIWKVQSASGGTLSETSAPLSDPKLVWTAPQEGGEFKVAASIASNGQATGAGGEVDVMVATPTPLPTPTPVPTPTPPPTPTPKPQASAPPAEEKPAAAAPAPSGGGSNMADTGPNPDLVHGIQSHLFEGNPGQKAMAVRNMGFQVVKQQVRWCDLEGAKGAMDLSQLDRIVNEVSGQGVKLLFSVVCPPGWAQGAHGLPANYDDYANFVAAMATRYDGKVLYYEIWNEQNLKRGAEDMVPTDVYVAFLKHVYTKVKAANPNVIVISGAPTPAGNVAGWAIDDIDYLKGMYAAGLKDACDAVGAHPSGYNTPPDADWQTWSDPTARFRGPSDNHHHSWVFRGTMEGYRAVMVANGDGGKKIWPTEFGWASSPNPVAGYEYSADNSEGEQAQYLVKAFQMMRNWPWVGGAVVWNLDFNVFKAGSEEAAFGIYGRPAYDALAKCRGDGSC
jgi:spore germination protein YaaH